MAHLKKKRIVLAVLAVLIVAFFSVSKHNFDSPFASTEWSIVYNQSGDEVCYYHRENCERFYPFDLW